MAHFANIQSLADLKNQYRKLAFQNHPDKGGNVEVMKSINNEYDNLYKIWVNKIPVEMQPADKTGESSRRRFYTAYGWEGSRYDSKLSTKDIAKLVRDYCKEQWSQWKFSVRCHFASMCSEIRIELQGGPIKSAIIPNDEWTGKFGAQTSYRFHDTDKRIVEEAEVVMKDVVAYCMSYNYDDSDGMIDYFDTNFYLFEEIAGNSEWKEIHKTARIKAHPTETTVATKENSTINIVVVEYTEKSFAVFGDTKAIKERIKELGGRFNKFLKYNGEVTPGWVLSSKNKTKEDIEKLLLS